VVPPARPTPPGRPAPGKGRKGSGMTGGATLERDINGNWVRTGGPDPRFLDMIRRQEEAEAAAAEAAAAEAARQQAAAAAAARAPVFVPPQIPDTRGPSNYPSFDPSQPSGPGVTVTPYTGSAPTGSSGVIEVPITRGPVVLPRVLTSTAAPQVQDRAMPEYTNAQLASFAAEHGLEEAES